VIGRIWLKWIDEEGWLLMLADARITRRLFRTMLSRALAAKVPCASFLGKASYCMKR
jgi:hypothetical protein